MNGERDEMRKAFMFECDTGIIWCFEMLKNGFMEFGCHLSHLFRIGWYLYVHSQTVYS